MAKVTVAVPAFKIEEKYLRICLDSILQQTLHDIEVILIVDPIDEVCNRVCVEYAGKDDRIRLMQEKDEGYCVWRNYAIERASSKWLMYVDGDDYIAPDNCEIVYEKAEKTQPDILFWGATKVYEGTDKQVPYVSFHENIEEFTPALKELLQMKLLVGDMGFYPAISAKAATGVIWNKLYNREFLLREKLRLNPQVDRAEDVVFNM
ncbi:MAG: glycosyltransferase family A protein, partial [bacterium]|nr:glycosyltransferase family A protein [bacterium]